MKATQKDFAAVVARAARDAKVFFLCGPDEAGVADAVARIVALLDDPGERVDLSGAELKRDSVRLGDEARSNSLFGGNRHIVVRASGDEAYDAIENLLAGEGKPCPVIVMASGATDKSRTAKLVAARSDGLSAMFYPPDLKSAMASVRAMADAAGVRIGGDIAERIAKSCALDTRLARSEIAKLALYLDALPESPRSADGTALDAIAAHTEEEGFTSLVNVVLGGHADRLGGELKRMRDLGLNPVGLLLAFERRVAQLAQLSAKLGPKGNVVALLDAEAAARRVFWKDKADLSNQLRRWRGPSLGRLVERLMGLHRALLTNSQNAELLLSQGLSEIARQAAR